MQIILTVILTTIIVICLLILAFYLGYKTGKKTIPASTQDLNKDSINYLNQFLNMMNYNGGSIGKGGVK